MRILVIETTLYIAICLAIYFLMPSGHDWLAYYHRDLQQFEFWRLITATFCHLNVNHLLINLVSLVLILSLFVHTFKKQRLLPLILFMSLFIGVFVFLLEENSIGYVGFSGVLHGLFSFGVLKDIQRNDKWGYVLGTGLLLKTSQEQFFGANQTTSNLIGAPVIVSTHLYGVIAGVIYYFLSVYLINKKNK